MELLRTLFMLISITSISTYSDSNLANVNYYDLSGKYRSLSLPYIINPQKVQYGVKFGVNAYYLDIKDCKLKVGDDMVEYFAAYLTLTPECNPVDVVKDAIAHGADFIFVDVSKLDDYSLLTSKKFDIPVFPIDKSFDKDVFKFAEVDYDRRYINIEFLIVS